MAMGWGWCGQERDARRARAPAQRKSLCRDKEPGLHSKANRQLLPRRGVCLMPGLCHVALRILYCLMVSPRLCEYTENQLPANTR